MSINFLNALSNKTRGLFLFKQQADSSVSLRDSPVMRSPVAAADIIWLRDSLRMLLTPAKLAP